MFAKISQAATALVTRKLEIEIDMITYKFRGLRLKKVTNWLRTESSVIFKPSRPWGMPTILQVEPTNRCNLRCKGCPAGWGLNRSIGDMSLEIFRGIVDELRDYLLMIMFWDWGEPFLNPHAYDMINYAHQSGIKVVSSTNGHLLLKEDHARQVVESGLDALVFSVDGIKQETYQQYRTDGVLDQVLESIRKVRMEKRRLNSETPLINLRFIVMKHNQGELPELRDFSEKLGVDALTVRKFGPWTRLSGFTPDEVKYQLAAPQPTGRTLANPAGNPCKNLWNCPTVHWDGTLCSCFMDYDEEYPLGHLGKETFREVWYGSAFQRMRRHFGRKWHELPLCGKCSCGLPGGDVGREANAEVFFPKGM